MKELPFETWERMTGMAWPNGDSKEIVAWLQFFNIPEVPGTAKANLRLQDCMLAFETLKRATA
jgi:hypothetical protein